MIVDSKYNDDFHLEENSHQFVMVDNQDISDVEEEIEQYFSVDYTERISVHLAS